MRNLGGKQFAPPADLGEPLAATAFSEIGLLRGALGGTQSLARTGQRCLGFIAGVAHRLAPFDPAVKSQLQFSDLRRELALLRGALRMTRGQAFGLLRKLRAAPGNFLGVLPQLHDFELEVVAAPLLRHEGLALAVVLVLPALEIGFDSVEAGARGTRQDSGRFDGRPELGEFALAR